MWMFPACFFFILRAFVVKYLVQFVEDIIANPDYS